MDPKAVVASLIAGTDLIRPTAPVLRLVKQHEQFFNVTSGDPKETDLVRRRRLYRHDPGRFAHSMATKILRMLIADSTASAS
jgi:hypothetical protein